MSVLPRLQRPTPAAIDRFIKDQAGARLSYNEVGLSRPGASGGQVGFVEDCYRVALGHGAGDFERAAQAIRGWQMFQLGWVEQFHSSTLIVVGQAVAVLVKIFGTYWLNAARIVYVLDEVTHDGARRFGFAYGTLAEHAECGEERFMVEMLADESVHYDIRAFSRPQAWLAWLGYPLARSFQKAFGRDSKQAMVRYMQARRQAA